MDESKKSMDEERILVPREESMNDEEYKKQTDTLTKVFGINSTISSSKMAILNTIKAALEELQDEVDLTNYVSYITNSKEGMHYYFDTLYEYPELFYPDLTVKCYYYTDNNGKITRYYLKVTYIYSSAVVKRMKSYLTGKIKEIKNYYLDNVSGDLEKEYIIHDYLLENCTYDTSTTVSASSHTSYGALLSGKAVCDGYAKAAKLLFNECNIDAGIVTSDSMNHAWNYLKMNGDYYFLDVTWDDPVPETFISQYGYFNRNTKEMISGAHSWVTENYPVSTSTVFSFLRNYSKLTRSNDKLYYYDYPSKVLYGMTLDGKNKAAAITNFYYNNNLDLIGCNNNLYYVRSIYNNSDKTTSNVVIEYNLTTKLEKVMFNTAGSIKKIYKKNYNLFVQYTASQNTSSISTKNISIEVKYDTNRDGVVNSIDAQNVASRYNKQSGESGYLADCDFNKDGIIDIYDIVKVNSQL